MTPAAFQSSASISCAHCTHDFPVQLTHVVLPDTDDWTSLQTDDFNRVVCPHCRHDGVIMAPFLLLHADRQYGTCFITDCSQLSHDQQSQLVHHLRDRLYAGLEQLGLDPVELNQVGVTERYEMVILLVQRTADPSYN